MKKIMALVLALCMVLALCACGSEPSTQPAEATADAEPAADGRQHVKIACLWEQLTEGITLGKNYNEKWAAEYNADEANPFYIDALDYYSADYKVETQISQIEDVIVKGYDALVISSLDRTAVLPALKEAHDAGIKVIDSRFELDGDFIDVSVNCLDNVGQGLAIKGLVEEYLDANPDVVLYTGIIWHEQTVTSCLPRCQGVKDLAEERPDQVKILAEIYTNSTDVAQATMEDWLQAYPEMNFVDCSMDESARGAYNAMKASGIGPGEILMASVDGSEVGCDMLKEGYMTWLVGFSLYENANIPIRACLSSLSGEYETGYKLVSSDIQILTPDMDLDKYLVENGWKA